MPRCQSPNRLWAQSHYPLKFFFGTFGRCDLTQHDWTSCIAPPQKISDWRSDPVSRLLKSLVCLLPEVSHFWTLLIFYGIFFLSSFLRSTWDDTTSFCWDDSVKLFIEGSPGYAYAACSCVCWAFPQTFMNKSMQEKYDQRQQRIGPTFNVLVSVDIYV
jgi:hypothetical protein